MNTFIKEQVRNASNDAFCVIMSEKDVPYIALKDGFVKVHRVAIKSKDGFENLKEAVNEVNRKYNVNLTIENLFK